MGGVGQPAHSVYHHTFIYQFLIVDFSLIPRPSSKEERTVEGMPGFETMLT